MFDAVRNNKRIVQGFMALITLPFAFFGVDSYIRSTGPGQDVAVVGDSKISLQQFQQTWHQQMDNARRQLGSSFKLEMFDTPELRHTVLNSLVDQRILALEAQKSRLGISDDRLREIITSMSALQVDSKFSQGRYDEFLVAQGMSPAQFEARVRQDMIIQQLIGSVGETGVVPVSSVERLMRIQGEERQVEELRITPDQMLGDVKLADGVVQKFYDENRKKFETLELVRAEYVTLSVDALLAQSKVSETEIKEWYDSHVERYVRPEQRRASHILITLAANASKADKDKAKEKAEQILAEVQKHPANFGELAKQHSQDPGSAANGGDLGFFGRGAMVKAFDDSVFALKQGEMSGLVQSDFGFHIIKLTGIQESERKRLEEVRPEIEGELKRQYAQRQYAEAAEAFTNMVYEQSDSLAPVVEKFKLKLEQTPLLPKEVPPQSLAALGPLANEKLRTALFSDDAIKNKRNTDAVEVAPNTLIAARVIEHKPAAVLPFDKVHDDVEALLKSIEAAKLAKQVGESRLGELKGGQDKLRWVHEMAVSRTPAIKASKEEQVSAKALQAIFHADTSKLPAYAGVELPNNAGYALYKITAVKPLEKIDGDKRLTMQRQYTALLAEEDFAGYLASLRKRYKVEINKSLLEKKDNN